MALQKSLATPFGVNAEYWRIIRVNENFDGQAEVYLAGYASDEARRTLSEPLDMRVITIASPDATRADLYPLLKESKIESRPTEEVDEEGNTIMEEVETNDFVDAIDC